jgi:carbon storage regulator
MASAASASVKRTSLGFHQEGANMLVLTRLVGDEIVVPDINLTFTILEIRGGKVRVGIAAPPNVRIHRREVWMRIQEMVADETSPSATTRPTSGGGGVWNE